MSFYFVYDLSFHFSSSKYEVTDVVGMVGEKKKEKSRFDNEGRRKGKC